MSDWDAITNSLTAEKRAWDKTFPWIAYVCRPISYPVSWFCHRIGMTANHVTGITALLGITALPLLASGHKTAMFWGAMCLVVYSILDCVDGNLARAYPSAGPPLGKFWDQLVGNFYTLSYLSIGLGLSNSFPTRTTLWIILGALSTIGKYATYHIRYTFWTVLGDHWTSQKATAASPYVSHTGRWYYRLYHTSTHLQGHVILVPLAIILDFLSIFLIATAIVTLLELTTCLLLYLKRSWQMRTLS